MCIRDSSQRTGTRLAPCIDCVKIKRKDLRTIYFLPSGFPPAPQAGEQAEKPAAGRAFWRRRPQKTVGCAFVPLK